MSHTDAVVCDITDPDGNHFQVSGGNKRDGSAVRRMTGAARACVCVCACVLQVMKDGQVSVSNVSPVSSTVKQSGKASEEKHQAQRLR